MSFRAWGPKQNGVYALSVGATQADAILPTGFTKGGNQAQVYNSGATDVLVAFYTDSKGAVTLTFPVTGSPPTGQFAGAQRTDASVVVVPKGARIPVSIPLGADSFSAIGSAAGPSIIYVQRGDGSL